MLRIWAIAVAMTIASGCGSDSKASPSVSIDLADLRAASLTDDAARTVFLAEDLLIRRCMTERGFIYPVVAYVSPPRSMQDSLKRWGAYDAGIASVNGYHDPELTAFSIESDAEKSKETDVLAGMTASEREGYLVALVGTDSNKPPVAVDVEIPDADIRVKIANSVLDESCTGRAQIELGGDRLVHQALREVIGRISSEADVEAEASSAFQTTLNKWRDCFVASGFDATDPLDALAKYTAPGNNPGAEEVKAAVADVTCKTAVAFDGAWARALQTALDDSTESEAAILLTWSTVRQQLIESSKVVIAQL